MHDFPSNAAVPKVGDRGFILEGIVSTLGVDAQPHIAPMGPIIDESFDRLWLRPFCTSETFKNLSRTRAGVFHVTDDVELIARAAVGNVAPLPRLSRAESIDGFILADACRWFAFQVESIDDSTDRTCMVGRVVDRGVLREFIGFNRAKHAVVEAAILATRVHLLDASEVQLEFTRLASLVSKTAAAAECRAFDFLRKYVQSHSAAAAQ